MIEDLPLDVVEDAFYDELTRLEMQKEANLGAALRVGKAMAKPMTAGFGSNLGRMAKFWGTRAGIGAGIGAAGGAATAQEGSRMRGALGGAGVGAAGGLLFGAGQAGRAAVQLNRAAMAGKGLQGARGAYSTLRQAGFSRQGLRSVPQAWRGGKQPGAARQAWNKALAEQQAAATAV